MIDVGRLKDIINAGCDDCAMDDEWRADAIAWVEVAAAPVEPAPGLHKITDALADEPDPFDVIETLQARIARMEEALQSMRRLLVPQPSAVAKALIAMIDYALGEDKG